MKCDADGNFPTKTLYVNYRSPTSCFPAKFEFLEHCANDIGIRKLATWCINLGCCAGSQEILNDWNRSLEILSNRSQNHFFYVVLTEFSAEFLNTFNANGGIEICEKILACLMDATIAICVRNFHRLCVVQGFFNVFTCDPLIHQTYYFATTHLRWFNNTIAQIIQWFSVFTGPNHFEPKPKFLNAGAKNF